MYIESVRPADQCVYGANTPNLAVTVTVPAGGPGQFIYITRIRIWRVSTAALAGGAILGVTTTNLPGGPNFDVGNAMAAGGTQVDMDGEFVPPIKASVAATAVTIIFPVPGAGVAWRCLVWFYYDVALP